ncbi:MAG: hypothetical protein JST51_11175 [Armatimonadetes bacterium]|nr:hypothetical protein [Armatimonadota bacterium]
MFSQLKFVNKLSNAYIFVSYLISLQVFAILLGLYFAIPVFDDLHRRIPSIQRDAMMKDAMIRAHIDVYVVGIIAFFVYGLLYKLWEQRRWVNMEMPDDDGWRL